jgi:hypothetical protein
MCNKINNYNQLISSHYLRRCIVAIVYFERGQIEGVSVDVTEGDVAYIVYCCIDISIIMHNEMQSFIALSIQGWYLYTTTAAH